MKNFIGILKQTSFIFISSVIGILFTIYISSRIQTPSVFTDSSVTVENPQILHPQFGFPFPVFYKDSGCIGGTEGSHEGLSLGCVIGEIDVGLGGNNEAKNFLFYFALSLFIIETLNLLLKKNNYTLTSK